MVTGQVHCPRRWSRWITHHAHLCLNEGVGVQRSVVTKSLFLLARSSWFLVFAGRKNWNIAKSQAHFQFTPNPHAKKDNDLPYSKISVADPLDPDHPFFVAELTPSFMTSMGLPFNSAYVPMSLYMAHPPLPESLKWKEDARVGTDQWSTIESGMTGKAGVFWAKGGLPGGKYGDGVGFPDVSLWSFGTWLRDFKLDFPVGKLPGPQQRDTNKTK